MASVPTTTSERYAGRSECYPSVSLRRKYSLIRSGLTYLTERFKGFSHGGDGLLQGVPRSVLAAFAEENL